MEFIPYPRQENRPFIQLLYLMLGALGGMFLSMIIGFLIVAVLYGLPFLTDLSWLNGSSPQAIGALKILLTAQQIGLFLFPALLLAITEGKRPAAFYGLRAPKWQVLGLVLLLMLVSVPMMGGLNALNQKMELPGFLKGMEDWMRRLEEENGRTTEAMLKMRSLSDYLGTMLVVAFIPAICEEFMFRAGLLRILLRWIKNPHVAIWLGAAIFSTIHFQFFGFFPRLLLGVGFGYMYYWTGSLWYSVFAHFLNNGFAVTVSWYFQSRGGSIDDDMPVQWLVVVFSLIASAYFMNLLKNKGVQAPSETL